MKKLRFVIVGSGWRSLFYVRIAKNLPQYFELPALLCRSKEKADKIAFDEGIHTTVSVEECVALKPDFVVVAVNKDSIADVGIEWLERGFKVLCETPVAFSVEKLDKIKNLPEKLKKNLFVAEQYIYFPSNQALMKILEKRLIGDVNFVNISLTNDHHAASLIRNFLGEKPDAKCRILKNSFSFPSAEYMNRYERFSDGHISEKKRGLFLYEFEDGKVAAYDFDSEQYRSPIRNSFIKIQGTTGEIFNETVSWLDEKSEAHYGKIFCQKKKIVTDYENPNLKKFDVIEKIEFEFEGKKETLYENPFGNVKLSDDERAIASLMLDAANSGAEFQNSNLLNAIRDAEMAMD